MKNKNYKSWYTVDGEEEEPKEDTIQGTSSEPTPVSVPTEDTTLNQATKSQELYTLESEGFPQLYEQEGGNFGQRAPINDPNSLEFDPEAEGSRTSTGEVRRSRAEWDEYNKQSAASSGDMMAQGVVFGGGGGNTIVNPMSASSPKLTCPVCKSTASTPSYKAIIPSFLAGALAFFLVNKYILNK